MAALYRPSEFGVSLEVGEYQQFPKSDPDGAATGRSEKTSVKYVRVLLLSFGLLCVLQAALNIALRLHSQQSSEKEEEAGCPAGWLMFQSSCYLVSSQRGVWDQGRQDCVQRDADLVIVNSPREQAFLTGFTEQAWVGMTDREEEGTWLWVDGTPVDKEGLLWAPGQPDDAFAKEDCGDLHTRESFIGLNDSDCMVQAQWICEKTLR